MTVKNRVRFVKGEQSFSRAHSELRGAEQYEFIIKYVHSGKAPSGVPEIIIWHWS